MKIYFHILFPCLLSISFLFFRATAQSPSKPPQMVFEQIVKADSLSAAELTSKATEWLNKNYKNSNIVSNSDSSFSLSASDRFLVYTKGMVSKEIHGAIRYSIQVDIKQGKYKYLFKDFVFEYYKQNRQYKYEPTGKTKPMEEEKFPGWQHAWDRYKTETKQKVEMSIVQLKKAMAERKEVNKEKLPVEKW